MADPTPAGETDGWAKRLGRAWLHVERPDHDGVTSMRIASTDNGRDLLLGLDREGLRHLTVPTAPGDSPRTRTTDGEITVRKRTLAFDRTTAEVIDVACLRPERFEDFDELCGILVPDLIRSDKPASHLVETMSRWRQLLRERARQGLSFEERLGLYGELAVLERLAEMGLRDISSWQGPLAGLHDIVLPGGWIEVKTKVSRPTVRIHGLNQTTPPDDGGQGFLAVVEVDESAEVGMKISELIDKLTKIFDREEFTERLTAAGWRPTDEPDLRYAIQRIAYHNVTSLPGVVVVGEGHRIANVGYDLDVNGLPETTEEGLGPLLERTS